VANLKIAAPTILLKQGPVSASEAEPGKEYAALDIGASVPSNTADDFAQDHRLVPMKLAGDRQA